MKDLHVTRRQILKGAGAAGVLGALGVPATAFAEDEDGGSRIFIYVSFSQAPKAGLIVPRMGMSGAGTFRPGEKDVNGGGNYVLSDFGKPNPKPLLATGRWKAREFVSYTTTGLASYGTIQPGILVMKADVDGIGKNLELAVVCNVGAVPLNTGEEEGWELSGTRYGTFKQLTPPVGISHLSVEGFRIGGD